MSNDFSKFLFLGVMIAAVLFFHRGQAPQEQLSLSYGAGVSREAYVPNKPAPIFILEPPQKILAENFGAVASVNQLIKSTESAVDQGAAISSKKDDPPQANDPFLTSSDNQGPTVFHKVGDESAPEFQAQIALVADLESGERYFNLEPARRWPTASITKLMSAVVAVDLDNQNASTTLDARDFPVENPDKNLKTGDRYSIKDLLSAALSESSNESAEAIANFFGREGFIAKMNAKGGDWGLYDTHFDDPTGLSASNQSTALDLFALAKNIYNQYAEVFKITRQPEVYVTELNSQKSFLVRSINIFAGRQDFLGGKTGYTDEASGNLLSVFSYMKRPIVIIVLGTPDRFGDTEKLLGWFEKNYK